MTLLLAVLTASLLGSVHCAAMCGGFVCAYAGMGGRGMGNGERGAARPVPLPHSLFPHLFYNLGRLLSYLALGALAGAIGSGVDRVGALADVSRGAAVVAGMLMVLWGGSTLLASSGIRLPRIGAPRALQARFAGAIYRLRERPPVVRAAATGLLTTLLPCGWLYAFAATAGGTGNPVSGMLVMLFFWLGTLPMMTAIGFGAQRLFGSFRRRLPLMTAGAAVVIGLLSIAGKMAPPATGAEPHAVPAAEVHHGGH
jgi:sulfite exporter TauE/SafE